MTIKAILQFKFHLYVVVGFIYILLTGCESRERKNINRETSFEQYPVSRLAMSRLSLPAPGIDSSNKVPIKIYKDKKIFEISIGPVDIPSQTPHMLLPVSVTALPFDLFIKGFEWSVTDENGKELPSKILHHFNIIDPNKRELFYPIARRLFAAGRETPSASLPPMIGVPMEADQPLLLISMFQNVSDTLYENIYFNARFTYIPGDRLIDPIEVYPFYLDVAGPIPPRDFEVPPGSSIHSDFAQPIVNGRIMGISGHLHDYGEKLMVIDTTMNKIIWQAKPIEDQDKEGYILSMPKDKYILPWRKRVNKGHVYRVVAQYKNHLDHPSPEMGMGAVGGIFRASPDTNWYKPDYNDSIYIDDMVMTLGAPKVHHWRELTPDEMRSHLGIKVSDALPK
ncbi:MAG: hypothetical protein ACOCVN_03080 [bacterium]